MRIASTRQMTKILAYELAHHFGGATVPGLEEETVAESVAYVACARFGLDTGERSFPHVFRAALSRIQMLSASLITRLEAPSAESAQATSRPLPAPRLSSLKPAEHRVP